MERRHVMGVLVVDRRWLLKCVRLWEPEFLSKQFRDLGLRIAPGAYLHLLPNIAGFVGADHVAMLVFRGPVH